MNQQPCNLPFFCITPSCTCRPTPHRGYCSPHCKLVDEREEDGPCECGHEACGAMPAVTAAAMRAGIEAHEFR
jgi:hypothetical protein